MKIDQTSLKCVFCLHCNRRMNLVEKLLKIAHSIYFEHDIFPSHVPDFQKRFTPEEKLLIQGDAMIQQFEAFKKQTDNYINGQRENILIANQFTKPVSNNNSE